MNVLVLLTACLKSLKRQRFLATNAILSLSGVSFLNPTGSGGYTTFSF